MQFSEGINFHADAALRPDFMLPTYPSSDTPSTPRHAILPLYILFAIYATSSAIAGASTCVAAIGIGHALAKVSVGFEAPIDKRALFDLFTSACGGALLGLPCGAFFWQIATLWPAARRPICAASVCASLSGTICLLMMLQEAIYFYAHASQALVLIAIVLAAGAFFGVVITWSARIMEGTYRRLVLKE